jgi:hypothetical protein
VTLKLLYFLVYSVELLKIKWHLLSGKHRPMCGKQKWCYLSWCKGTAAECTEVMNGIWKYEGLMWQQPLADYSKFMYVRDKFCIQWLRPCMGVLERVINTIQYNTSFRQWGMYTNNLEMCMRVFLTRRSNKSAMYSWKLECISQVGRDLQVPCITLHRILHLSAHKA